MLKMSNRRSEVKKIVLVLGTSVLAAFLLAAFFVLNYSPSGAYPLKSILIEPSVLSHLNYNDFNPRTGSSDRYVFDKITWKKGDSEENPIPMGLYEQVFSLLKNDKSLKEPFPNPFRVGGNPTLSIWVRTESSSPWQENGKTFQEIQFQGDRYRVELHEEKGGAPWVYFEHPGITASITRLLSL